MHNLQTITTTTSTTAAAAAAGGGNQVEMEKQKIKSGYCVIA